MFLLFRSTAMKSTLTAKEPQCSGIIPWWNHILMTKSESTVSVSLEWFDLNNIALPVVHFFPDLIFRAPTPIIVIGTLTVRTIQACSQRSVGNFNIGMRFNRNMPLRLSVRQSSAGILRNIEISAAEFQIHSVQHSLHVQHNPAGAVRIRKYGVRNTFPGALIMSSISATATTTDTSTHSTWQTPPICCWWSTAPRTGSCSIISQAAEWVHCTYPFLASGSRKTNSKRLKRGKKRREN